MLQGTNLGRANPLQTNPDPVPLTLEFLNIVLILPRLPLLVPEGFAHLETTLLLSILSRRCNAYPPIHFIKNLLETPFASKSHDRYSHYKKAI